MKPTLRRIIHTSADFLGKTINRIGMSFLIVHFAQGLIRLNEINPWSAYAAFGTVFSIGLYDVYMERMHPEISPRLCFLAGGFLTLLSMMFMPNTWSKANDIFVVLVWASIFTKSRMQ